MSWISKFDTHLQGQTVYKDPPFEAFSAGHKDVYNHSDHHVRTSKKAPALKPRAPASAGTMARSLSLRAS